MGRFGYFLVAGSAIFAGMVFQGDFNFDDGFGDREHARVASDERRADRRADRIVDRVTDRIVVRGADGQAIEPDAAVKRALAAAVAELVRAEGSLVAAKFDDNLPDAAIEQAEERRDQAREAVERLADDAREQTREKRDAVREIRDRAREEARAVVRS